MYTENTIMSNLAKLRVHIVPLGFEIDRIVLPAQEMKADKIWLLRHNNPSQDKSKSYSDKITKELKKQKISIEFAEADRGDVFNILKTVKEIFEKEKENDIYVNVSSGSKIQAIGCMMACMIFKECRVTPYYAEPESYPSTQGKQQSIGLKNIVSLPKYEIQKPRQELIDALKIIQSHDGKITKKEMAILAEEAKLITIGARDENQSQARFASLDKNIIQPLEEQWKFIEIEKIGRNRWIKITSDGVNAAKFLT
ncbi:MAG: hypothetical protein EA442_03855 [Candidatus Nitrosopelagicus sp.]|nr:MAG: hypothetical protein EA442_03855 [Candidatus Nitrosopelagicus sp.]